MSYGFGRLNDLADQAHDCSKRHGFYENRDPFDPTFALARLALIMSEAGEACEAVRKRDMENLSEELADIVIRVFDFSASRGINIEQAIVNKMELNEQRPHKHGGKTD
jgi:NTP pyrophosphatase (non-canonical NTP hydrolase)